MLLVLALSVGAPVGRVVDADGLPLARATVAPFERERGLPLHAKKKVPFRDRTVEWPDGRTVRAADLLAAEACLRLQRQVGRRER